MREDELGRAMKRIHERTPRWFSQFCIKCEHNIKGEPMWWVRTFSFAGDDKSWLCKRCASSIIDVLRLFNCFKDVDITPLFDDEAAAKRNADLGLPTGGSAGPP